MTEAMSNALCLNAAWKDLHRNLKHQSVCFGKGQKLGTRRGENMILRRQDKTLVSGNSERTSSGYTTNELVVHGTAHPLLESKAT
eukprot:m.47843 g.47843  ORF g.47843 m.47843 type:complete len:85 (+) comp12353_c0_seq3:39-293(+)